MHVTIDRFHCIVLFSFLQDPSPVETIPIIDLNVTLQGQTGHPNGMQITAILKGKSRNIFVYAEHGHVSFCRIKYSGIANNGHFLQSF